MSEQRKSLELAQPYRPFRLIAHAVISLTMVFVVWFPLTLLTGGFVMGPAEDIQFSSLEEARRSAFSDYGMAWPGSRTKVAKTGVGYVVERRWLVWSEIRLPLETSLSTDTARYELGPGEAAQQTVVLAIALAAGAAVFFALRRRAKAATSTIGESA